MQGDRRFSSANNSQKQRIKNQQHYLEITRAVQEDLLTSEEELSAIASTTTLTQPSKLDYLWGICEKSQERSKLILSDSLQIPFYLPQNKVVYEKSEVLVEREKKRLEFLIQRDLKELLPGKVKDLDTLLPAKVKLSPREQEISNRVLSEYRHNPERYEQLQRHLQDQKRRKHGLQPPLPFTQSYMEKSVILKTTEERIQEAKFRREQLLQHELEKKNTLQKDIDEKLIAKKKKMKDILFNPLNTKQKLWLQVIAFTSIMHKTHAKVAIYRESKAKDLVKWKNATLIQRTYRRYRERQLGNTQQKIVMKRLRMSMLTINPDSTKLLQGRIDACTVITDFLISIQKNWKNFALNYIRKIKVIQRKWRRHMLQNHFRYLLVLSYIEKLIPLLFIHFSFILNGKGYDVQNLLANDMNQLSNSLKYYSFYSITEHIDSSPFHKFLRDINSQHHNPNVLSQILKFFGLLIHSPVHQQHHPKRVEANNNTAMSATLKGKLRPTPPSLPSRGFPGHHNHHGKSNSIGAAAQQIRPYAGLSAINPAVGTMPHPFFSTPEFMELQTPSNYLHQHNIRILTYHATPDPTYHQQYSSNINFHQTISSQHPFGYSYHKHYTLFDIIVKQCILQFIYEKRAKFIDKMDVNNPALTHFKFDVNDIKSFIHGEGYDPLQAQLETMMKKQEASFLQHQNYQIQKSLPYGSVKAGSTAVPGGSVAVGSGPGGGNNEIRNAMAEAIATVEQSSSNVPFTSITKDEGGSMAQQRSLLNQQDMEDFDVFGNPHVYKTSQITMLLLSEITAEDIIQLLIEITQILQLIPAPYLGNSNYNQSYIQLLRNQYLKNLKPVEIRKTTTKVPRLSGIDPFNSVMDDRDVVEQELNPSMISSFLFVDDSPVQTPAIVESKGRRGNTTIQKGVPQQLALLVQSDELYRDVYEFFHHYVGRQFPLSSAPTHRSSNATNDLAETRSSREGSVSSQASGASNPVSVAAIAAAAAARQRNAAGTNPAQIANLRKSILAGRSDMHRLSVAVASQQAKGAEFLKRKTSVIPENQRKYGKNRRTEGDFDENEDEDDDEEEESDTFGSPLRLSPKQPTSGTLFDRQKPMRPNFLRKSSVMPVANQHRKLSTLGNK